jgi:hypothetical protein
MQQTAGKTAIHHHRAAQVLRDRVTRGNYRTVIPDISRSGGADRLASDINTISLA